MARPRTGSMVLRPRGGVMIWHAIVTVDVDDPEAPGGKRPKREWYSLETDQEPAARAKLERLVKDIANGLRPGDVAAEAARSETVAEYAERWLTARAQLGIGYVEDERRILESHVLPSLGGYQLAQVRPAHVRDVLQGALKVRAYARSTLTKIRGVVNRMLTDAWRDDLIPENPVAKVVTPAVRSVKRDRVILTDLEVARLVGCEEAPLEIRIMAACSRALGGMRTGDLNGWRYEDLDLHAFTEARIPRKKTQHERAPQRLEIPHGLRPWLRRWWEESGSPTSGPVFPVQRGCRAGEQKSGETTYAKPLRVALLIAGVKRHECTREADERAVRRGDACCPNIVTDELYTDTKFTRRVDFHSFRRGYATGLATAGVNAQHAAHLTGHTDLQVHARYLMNTPAMRVVPEAALPLLAAPLDVSQRVPAHRPKNGAIPGDTRGAARSRRETQSVSSSVVGSQGIGPSIDAMIGGSHPSATAPQRNDAKSSPGDAFCPRGSWLQVALGLALAVAANDPEQRATVAARARGERLEYRTGCEGALTEARRSLLTDDELDRELEAEGRGDVACGVGLPRRAGAGAA